MYCTPCARLMKSITPKTSVSPAAIRNSSTPSCRPLRVWTMRRVVDMKSVVVLTLPPQWGEGAEQALASEAGEGLVSAMHVELPLTRLASLAILSPQGRGEGRSLH